MSVLQFFLMKDMPLDCELKQEFNARLLRQHQLDLLKALAKHLFYIACLRLNTFL